MISEIVTGVVAAAIAGGTTFGICRSKMARLETKVDSELEVEINNLEKVAYYDDVTGLPNMTKFNLDCAALIAANPDSRFGIAVLEIDNLSNIRRLYGLAECDRVRCFVADKMREVFEGKCCYGRVHEDLFAYFTNYETVDDVNSLAEELTKNLSEYSSNVILEPVFGMYKMTDFDEAFMHYNYESKGSIIVDKDLNVVYTNEYDRFKTLYRTQDAYKLFHDFGPCALAFVSPEGFDATAQKDFKKLFEARMQEHAAILTDPAKVAEEKAQFEKAFEILQKEYDKIQEKNGSSMGE